ncbi:MAG: pYEATS domain-containing protein [Bacteroidota bacterium]
MKILYNFFSLFRKIGDTRDEDKTDLNRMLNRFLFFLFVFTIALWIIIFWLTRETNALAHLTFLGVAGACLLAGIATGFLFGIPRAEKYRYKPDADHNINPGFYSDNTNLEEISDWLTKIIVGLTLVKFNTLLGWLNHAALSMGATMSGEAPCEGDCTGYFVFSYAIIIMYIIAGLGASYLWTRTYFMLILIVSKKEQERLQREEIIKKQAIANAELAETPMPGITEANRQAFEENDNGFMELVKEKYKKTPVPDKTDLQKSRWGGKDVNNNWKLAASVDMDRSFMGLYKLVISIKGADPAIPVPVTGMVAFFLHDTFPREIVFVKAQHGEAKLEVTAYEAFTVGAMLEDGTTLELDLNDVPGYPRNFYWDK